MKKELFLLCVLSVSHTQHAHRSYSIPETAHESVEDAQQRFNCMSAQQINNLNMRELTPNQIQAFKSHAKKLFHAEVATPCCHSQADRIKYEIMYQKLGELHPALTSA